MATETILQANFSGGELSPHIHDRVDVEAYWAGCAKITNFVPLPHGPLLRRRGSYFIREVGTDAVRLIPFTFSIDQSFVLEFTPGRIRFYYDGGILVGTGGAPVTIQTDYTATDIKNLNWAQNGDWLYLVDGNHRPRVLKRYSNESWALEDLVFVGPPSEWRTDNYPRFVALYQQRAYYAGTPKQPQQIWASRTGIYEDLTQKSTDGTILDDHGFTYTIFSNDTNGIVWLHPGATLLVGTSGAEFKIGATSAIDVIKPSNISISVQTTHGSAKVRPVGIGSSLAMVQRSGRRIRSIDYTYYEDRYTASDLTIYASHIMTSAVKEMVVQSAPDSYLWCVLEDGKLVGCTYEKNQKVLAWHRHETDGEYKSICVLPSSGGDKLYVAVKRKNGTFMELFTDPWEPAETIEEAFYVDSGLSYDGEAISSFTGLSHLEGQTVSVLVDGWIHPDVVVTNGSIALQQTGKKVHAGLPYTSEYLSMIPQSQQQITVGVPRRIVDITVALEDSIDFFYRTDNIARAEIAFGGPTTVMNAAVPLKSFHKTVPVNGLTSATQQMYLWQNRPIPLIIRGIVFRTVFNSV